MSVSSCSRNALRLWQLRKKLLGTSRPIITSRRDACSCKPGILGQLTHISSSVLVPSSNGSRLPENVEAAGARLEPFRIRRRRVEVPNADTQYYCSYYSDMHCDTAEHRDIAIWHHDESVSCCPNCNSMACFCNPLTSVQHSVVPKVHHGGCLALAFL